ncbi:hypothetical protein [Actinomadura decatromicini]|uniref:hypothetical protein n=1 Tax=Actinomadura decatromicini TaxID=2604572 RepID=UPI00165337C0|nr:hypothetical protein [Actinomadura decatromicini]
MFLFYYEDDDEQESERAARAVWRELRAQSADWLFVCALAVAVLILSDRIG